MAVRRSTKLGLFVFTSATILLYLFLPENAHTASSNLTNKLPKNKEDARSFLTGRTICLFDACFRLTSLSTGLFLETVFQMCLSNENWNMIRVKKRNAAMIHIVVVACGDRLEETLVNIKSSILFTKKEIFFHIFAEEDLQPGFKNGIESWPLEYRKNLQYQLYPITYPEDGNEKNWKKLFKPCASQRLFLPLVMSEDIDSVLYVDTDILFLTDVSEFWNLFSKFNSTQLSSLCIEHEDKRMGWYNRFARHPYYGTTGLNSGVMLMNLTRLRNVKYKNDLMSESMTWKDMLLPLYNKYRYNITWGDQDLLNIIFHHNPEMLYMFSCEWNYRPDHCMYGQMCKVAKSHGVKILHGNRGVYHNDKQPAFKAVYETIKSYNFQDDLIKHLFQVMQMKLKDTESTYCGKEYECILKGLYHSIEKMKETRSD